MWNLQNKFDWDMHTFKNVTKWMVPLKLVPQATWTAVLLFVCALDSKILVCPEKHSYYLGYLDANSTAYTATRPSASIRPGYATKGIS